MKLIKQLSDGRRNQRKARIILFVTCLLASALLWVYGEISTLVLAIEPVSPLGVVDPSLTRVVPAPKEVIVEVGEVEKELDNPQKLDLIIGEAVDEFFTNRAHRSEMRMIAHCLAHRENGHAANQNCGDSGKACGPMQFHQETWNRMRNQMIKAGLTTEIGDRYDLKESVRTAMWAIKNGRAREWGPILRDSKGSDYATCQLPSFYVEKSK